jgi:TRAP-type C4-dicarboxylate transport system substrate-binding protein
MYKFILRIAAAAFVLLPMLVSAEPIKLKLAFFSSDRTHIFRAAVKPFVDAVNSEGKGRIEIEVYLSGKLGNDLAKQPQLLLDGTADIAYVVPSYDRAGFPDSAVIELPGLFQDGREASLAYSRLVAGGLVRDLKDYFVLGAFASEPESIHVHAPVATLADLKGKRIRANNSTEIALFKKLGITPVFLPINETAEAVSSGRIDGATVPPVLMMEFGIGRVTPYHYLLKTSCVPLLLLMNRKKFESLPDDVRALIRKHSGDWLVANYIQINETSTDLVMDQLAADPKRTVIVPSTADMQIADAAFKAIVDEFAASNPHNAELVNAAKTEAVKLRMAE